MGSLTIDGYFNEYQTSYWKTVQCVDAVYSKAREGTGTLSYAANTGTGGRYVGQYTDSLTGPYRAYQTGIYFDLAAEIATLRYVIIESVLFKFRLDGVSKGSSSEFDVEVRGGDFGGWLTTGAFVPGSRLGDYPLYANIDDDSLTTATIECVSSAAFLALLADPYTRPDALSLLVAVSTQRTGLAPTYANQQRLSMREPQLVVTWSNYAVSSESSVYLEGVSDRSNMSFEADLEMSLRVEHRSDAALVLPRLVRVYNYAGTMLGVLEGIVERLERLDGANVLTLTAPNHYTRLDGTRVDVVSDMVDGWYFMHDGVRYLVQDYQRDQNANEATFTAYSAEVELEGYLTNYAQVPFSMPSHTPTEIMDAVLAGLPEADWYNGDFSQLDSSHWPLGWTDDGENTWAWALGTDGDGYVGLTQTATDGEAWLRSDGLNHVAGARIKVKLDVWVDDGFEGVIDVHTVWTNTADVESSRDTEQVAWAVGQWVTFESADWIDVRNSRCALLVEVHANDALKAVRVRRVRFVQEETDTGWTYQGDMDSRSGEIAYNDAGWQAFGGWITDITNSYVYSTTKGDVLSCLFTGDFIQLAFAGSGLGATVDILVDGVTKASAFPVATTCSKLIDGLNRYRTHVLEIVVKTVGCHLSGATISTENRIAVTWNRLSVYEALRELKAQVGGEYSYDTGAKTIYHSTLQGAYVTDNNLVWLREHVNLENLVPDTEVSVVANRLYWSGYGDGAYQIGLVVDAVGVDEDGNTSQTLYGIKRRAYTNKDIKDLAAGYAEARALVEASAFPVRTYAGTAIDTDAAYLRPGDTVRVTHTVIGTKELRVLEMTRRTGEATAAVRFGTRVTARDATMQTELMRRQVARLLRAY